MEERLALAPKTALVEIHNWNPKLVGQIIEGLESIEDIGGYIVTPDAYLYCGINSLVKELIKGTNRPIINKVGLAGDLTTDRQIIRLNSCLSLSGIIISTALNKAYLEDMISEVQDIGLTPIVTVNGRGKNLEKEGGFLLDSTPGQIADTAVSCGVRDLLYSPRSLEATIRYWELLEDFFEGEKYNLFVDNLNSRNPIGSRDLNALAGNRWHEILPSDFFSFTTPVGKVL